MKILVLFFIFLPSTVHGARRDYRVNGIVTVVGTPSDLTFQKKFISPERTSFLIMSMRVLDIPYGSSTLILIGFRSNIAKTVLDIFKESGKDRDFYSLLDVAREIQDTPPALDDIGSFSISFRRKENLLKGVKTGFFSQVPFQLMIDASDTGSGTNLSIRPYRATIDADRVQIVSESPQNYSEKGVNLENIGKRTMIGRAKAISNRICSVFLKGLNRK